MALRYNGRLLTGLYYNGRSLNNLYYNGRKVWSRGGAPAISAFTVTPDKLLDSESRSTITLTFAVANSTSNTITETLADGTIRNVPLSGQVTVIDTPTQTARYRLVCRNINGTSTRTVTFYRGNLPDITTWTWGGFRQGIGAITPDSVLLTWAATGNPRPTLEISPSINYHPPTLSGNYRLSRVGAATSQTLALGATNVFGTVWSSLTINWPPRQGG